MKRFNWLPWRRIVSRLAKSRGLIDPFKALARLESFGQPMEIREPLELLRAGLIFHRRGLMNAAAIQHNLDWIWPYWVDRQYDPADVAFIPRAFSITHINLSHRNWTAVGLPDCDSLPIVDPRGLLTPFWDGWSIDAWIVAPEHRELYPSTLDTVDQHLDLNEMAVVTRSRHQGLALSSRIRAVPADRAVACRMSLTADGADRAFLVVSVRPYNPEGVSFIHEARIDNDRVTLHIDGRTVIFGQPPSRVLFSNYRRGDVHAQLFTSTDQRDIDCNVGMISVAALFPLEASAKTDVSITVPLQDSAYAEPGLQTAADRWRAALHGCVEIRVPDWKIKYLYDAAVRSLVLHSPDEIFAGPFTYKRFWFRDATFMMNALLCAGLGERVQRGFDHFWPRQTKSGHFLSQEGEWDSNGQALWIMHRYCELTGRPTPRAWKHPIRRAVSWIRSKRLGRLAGSPHAGLLPPGFSAEHLGPSDYYYWDNFWGVAGLRSAAAMMKDLGDADAAAEIEAEASRYFADIEKSLAHAAAALNRPGMPASPYRRLDSGAIGSLAAGYPLQLFAPDDPRLVDTARYLFEQCFVSGGFFLDVIHSGINAYLTLHIAQVLLRAGDPKALEIMAAVADLASPTGQWPEAIHPATRGGCMGDGHHAWAAAEWSMMIRNLFVREDGDGLILSSGIPAKWLMQPETLSIASAPTPFGDITIEIRPRTDHIEVEYHCDWRRVPAAIELRLPGFAPRQLAVDETVIRVPRKSDA